jgi:Alpha-L-fucosidase
MAECTAYASVRTPNPHTTSILNRATVPKIARQHYACLAINQRTYYINLHTDTRSDVSHKEVLHDRPLKIVSSAIVAALFATAVGLAIPSASPPAQAVDGISANWFESARYGIFSHYVPKLTIRSNGSLSASVDDAANNFNATQYAADVAAFGAQYVTFTVWHAGMQPLYPSAVMNSYRPGNSSQRDVIRDLINALAPYNITLVLYIHPVDGFEFTGADQAATGWGDSANGYKKWNDFVNAMVLELGNRYGTDVAGYWEDLAYDQTVMDKARLYTSMKSGNQSRIVIGNSGAGSVRNLPPTASTDYAALEYYEDAGPKPAGTWIAPLTNWKSDSNQNATIITGSWIADTPYGTSSSALMGKTATDIYRHTVMQAASNLHGGGMLWKCLSVYRPDRAVMGGWREVNNDSSR